MTASTAIRWDQDADGIVVLTLDDPEHSANTMNAAYRESLAATLDRLEAEKDSITGVVITSAKKTFFAGADLNELRNVPKDKSPEIATTMSTIKSHLRRLETLGKPVVAAINGAALGGGLEICLACHRRIALDDPKVQLGFPEASLGLLPGAGGVVRTVRMIGIASALMGILMDGQKRLRPAKAKEMGLVDELVATQEELVPAAKAWIKANPEAQQPWDAEKKYRIPGGTPSTPSLAVNLPAFPANLRKQTKGANYPALKHIMAVAVEGAQVDFDSALEIETRYFVDLVTGQVAKNMIQAFFFDLQKVSGDRGRPEGIEPFRPKKIVVLGAGMMGAAIAYVCAKAGMEVVLKDAKLEWAETRQGLFGEAVGEGGRARAARPRRTPTRCWPGSRRPRMRPTLRAASWSSRRCPRIRSSRQQVFNEIEPYLAPGALLGLQHLDAADHRSGRGRRASGGLHRAALLQPGGQDAAAGDHQGREDERRSRCITRST